MRTPVILGQEGMALGALPTDFTFVSPVNKADDLLFVATLLAMDYTRTRDMLKGEVTRPHGEAILDAASLVQRSLLLFLFTIRVFFQQFLDGHNNNPHKRDGGKEDQRSHPIPRLRIPLLFRDKDTDEYRQHDRHTEGVKDE